MMKSLGLDPDELKNSVEAFMFHMKAQAETINANQKRLEDKLDAISEKLDSIHPPASTTAIYEDGKHTGVLITTEKFPQEMLDDVLQEQRTREADAQERSLNES